MAFDLGHLGSAAGGAAFLKGVELALAWWRGRSENELALGKAALERETSREALESELRQELRGEVQRLRERVEGLEAEVAKWRELYWTGEEDRRAMRVEVAELRAMVGLSPVGAVAEPGISRVVAKDGAASEGRPRP